MTHKEPTLEDHIAWLKHSDPDVRRNAAWVLGRSRDIRIVEPLIAALNDDDPTVRLRVVESLGNLKDERVVESLMRVLAQDSDAEVRAYTAQSLGRSGDLRAVDPLMLALNDLHEQVRLAAIEALGALHDPRPIKPLVGLLVADSEARYSAAKALSQIGGPRTVDLLLDVLEDYEAPEICVCVMEILGQLYDARAVTPLKEFLDHEDEGVRETARWALRQLGQR